MRRILAGVVLALVLTGGAVAGSIIDDAHVLAGIDALDASDYATAVRIFRPLAEKGVAEAQGMLGTMYREGKGVPQSDAEAAKWHRLAAEQGLELSQNNLGIMFALGEGVPQDFVRAHVWLNLAAANGLKNAGELRDRLAARMTPAQIAEAQTLAREWKPK